MSDALDKRGYMDGLNETEIRAVELLANKGPALIVTLPLTSAFPNVIFDESATRRKSDVP